MASNGMRTVTRLLTPILALLTPGCHLVVGDFDTESSGECVDGQFTCTLDLLERCVDQTWVTEQTCGRPELCSAGEGRCQACAINETRCLDQRLELCNATLDGWTLLTECAAPLTCDATLSSCVACRAGSARCTSDGITLQTCSVNAQTWTTDSCGSQGCVDEPEDCDYCLDCAPEGRWVCSPCGKVLRCEGAQWRVVEDCLDVNQCVVQGSGGYCI